MEPNFFGRDSPLLTPSSLIGLFTVSMTRPDRTRQLLTTSTGQRSTLVYRLVTDFATAELVKAAANAFLATKISFINAMSEIADATGADVTQLADAIGHDARIGRRFLNAGVGFGGGCLRRTFARSPLALKSLAMAGHCVSFVKSTKSTCGNAVASSRS